MISRSKTNDTKNITPGIKRRVSYKKKQASNFKRQRAIIDAYDFDVQGQYRDYDRIKNYDVNYDLFNGRLDTEAYSDPVCFNVGQEEVELQGHTINHYPIISQVANAMYGEILNRPISPVAIDTGPSGVNYRSTKINEMLRELAETEIIQPTKELVQQKYMQQNGITDPFSLTIEEQKQVMADIQRRTERLTPERITDFIANDLMTPNQRVIQQLSDYLFGTLDIKSKVQSNGKHAICTGESIYYVGDRKGQPVFEVVNPKYFTAFGSQNTEWYQEMSWARYEQWFTITDVMQRYALEFSESNLRDLERMVEPIGGLEHVGDPKYDKVQERLMFEMSIDSKTARKYDGINYKTREGSAQFQRLYGDIISKYGEEKGHQIWNYGIRVAHITWRDKRPLKVVTRIENDTKVTYYRSENYEPTDMDLDVETIWVDEVWEAEKVGSVAGKEYYMNIRPIPGQYKSIHNPFGTDLPYYGRQYNSPLNNSKNVSPIDLGKPWQMEFDITMSSIKHDMSTDLGKVMVLPMMLKPEGWKWQDWMATLKNGKIAVTQLSRHGMNFDPGLLKNIDLSKTSDIAGKMNALQFNFQHLVRSMNFNDARIGAVGQYTTNENIVQSTSASYNQTEGFFDMHFKVAEKAINALINRTRILYKDKRESDVVYDDIARILANVTPDAWFESWGVKLSLSSGDMQKMEQIRGNMLGFIQNGMSFDGILSIMLADTPSEIVDTVRKESKRMQQERAAAMQSAQQARAAEEQKETQLEMAKMNQKLTIEREKMQSQERRAEINSEIFRKQADVDGNKVPDSVQKTLMELKAKEKGLIKEMEIEREKLRLKEKELELRYGANT